VATLIFWGSHLFLADATKYFIIKKSFKRGDTPKQLYFKMKHLDKDSTKIFLRLLKCLGNEKLTRIAFLSSCYIEFEFLEKIEFHQNPANKYSLSYFKKEQGEEEPTLIQGMTFIKFLEDDRLIFPDSKKDSQSFLVGFYKNNEEQWGVNTDIQKQHAVFANIWLKYINTECILPEINIKSILNDEKPSQKWN